MKSLSAAALTMLLFVWTSSIAAEHVSQEEWCGAISTLAKATMSGRQNDVPMSVMMDKIAGMESTNSRLYTISKGMIMSAYEAPRHYTESAKNTAVVEFQNKWYLQCMKSKYGQ